MYEYNFKLVRVVDGDTIDIDIDLGFGLWNLNERIRLAGIDTPESRTSDDIEKVFGLAAKARVMQLMREKDVVFKSSAYHSTGKFGRILGDFIIDGKSLVETLIEEGQGVPYYGQSKEVIQELHIANRHRLINEGKVTIKE